LEGGLNEFLERQQAPIGGKENKKGALFFDCF